MWFFDPQVTCSIRFIVFDLPSLGPIDQSVKIPTCMGRHQIRIYTATEVVIAECHRGDVGLAHGGLAEGVETVVWGSIWLFVSPCNIESKKNKEIQERRVIVDSPMCKACRVP